MSKLRLDLTENQLALNIPSCIEQLEKKSCSITQIERQLNLTFQKRDPEEIAEHLRLIQFQLVSQELIINQVLMWCAGMTMKHIMTKRTGFLMNALLLMTANLYRVVEWKVPHEKSGLTIDQQGIVQDIAKLQEVGFSKEEVSQVFVHFQTIINILIDRNALGPNEIGSVMMNSYLVYSLQISYEKACREVGQIAERLNRLPSEQRTELKKWIAENIAFERLLLIEEILFAYWEIFAITDEFSCIDFTQFIVEEEASLVQAEVDSDKEMAPPEVMHAAPKETVANGQLQGDSLGEEEIGEVGLACEPIEESIRQRLLECKDDLRKFKKVLVELGATYRGHGRHDNYTLNGVRLTIPRNLDKAGTRQGVTKQVLSALGSQ